MVNKFHEIAFTPGVKAAQERYGSRRHFAKFDNEPADTVELTDAEIDFLEQTDGFYMATVGESGQPYIQFRGGKPGFLKVLDTETLAFADFRGNLQYISTGNLAASNKAAIFVMDYANRRRLKLFVEVAVTDAASSPDMAAKLVDPDYKAKVERFYVMRVKAFEWNCPQHITPKFTAEQIERYAAPLRQRIAELEAENAKLKG